MPSLTHSSVASRQLDDGTQLISLHGEFDMCDADEVQERLLAALESSGAAVVVDLSEVTFLDSKFLRTLILVLHDVPVRRRPIALVKPNPALWRVFEVTGLDTLFPVYDSVAHATGAGAVV